MSEVRIALTWESYYGAALFVDGVQTGMDCGHNHKLPAAASKCIKVVEKRAAEMFGAPDLTQTEMVNSDGDRMVEFAWHETIQSRFTGPFVAEVRRRVSFFGQPPLVKP